MMDKVFTFEDLKVFVDATSLMYLNGCTVDYVESLEAAGFKFDNPQVEVDLPRMRFVVPGGRRRDGTRDQVNVRDQEDKRSPKMAGLLCVSRDPGDRADRAIAA